MSIELHCPKCRKLIKAPDHAGGKKGRCPFCKEKVYIPMPLSDDDVIPIVPVDEEAERRERQLREEATRYISSLGKAGKDGGPKMPAVDPNTLEADIEAFIRATHKSQLDQAEAAVARLKRIGEPASDYIRDLLTRESPPAFGDTPPPLVQGFLKNLLDRIR